MTWLAPLGGEARFVFNPEERFIKQTFEDYYPTCLRQHRDFWSHNYRRISLLDLAEEYRTHMLRCRQLVVDFLSVASSSPTRSYDLLNIGLVRCFKQGLVSPNMFINFDLLRAHNNRTIIEKLVISSRILPENRLALMSLMLESSDHLCIDESLLHGVVQLFEMAGIELSPKTDQDENAYRFIGENNPRLVPSYSNQMPRLSCLAARAVVGVTERNYLTSTKIFAGLPTKCAQIIVEHYPASRKKLFERTRYIQDGQCVSKTVCFYLSPEARARIPDPDEMPEYYQLQPLDEGYDDV